jgi:PrgI family protein
VRKHHEVPTHLNVEDKVVFGLTVRQFLYMLVGSSATYTAWEQLTGLPGPLRVAIGAVCVGLTLAFALLRPADRPLEEWLIAALVYAAVPRRCIWEPAEPEPADWRPAGGGWQELVPSPSWVEDEAGRS